MKYVLRIFSSRTAVASNKRKYMHGVLESWPRKIVVWITGRLDMTIDVDWDVKPHTKRMAIISLFFICTCIYTF